MSTFFPDDWTTKQVLDAIIEAYWNRVPADGGWFRGTSKGITIQMGIEYGPLGIPRIVTAYPIY